MNTLKERFDKAFYGLLDVGKQQQEELYQKLNYADKLIELNKVRQKQIQNLLNNK